MQKLSKSLRKTPLQMKIKEKPAKNGNFAEMDIDNFFEVMDEPLTPEVPKIKKKKKDKKLIEEEPEEEPKKIKKDKKKLKKKSKPKEVEADSDSGEYF
jgi:hypothetical protein